MYKRGKEGWNEEKVKTVKNLQFSFKLKKKVQPKNMNIYFNGKNIKGKKGGI